MFITITVLICVFGFLILTRVAADVILMAAMLFLVVTGVLNIEQALAGFANQGVLTIAALYVVAGGLRETGAVDWCSQKLLGQPRNILLAQLRLFLPVSLLSAFMNNTAVVAMFIPAVQDWSRRLKLAPSKLLLPLSYMAIIGGTCTLMGTSTNLVVDGLLQAQKSQSLSMFELAWLGIPLVIASGLFLLLFSRFLLPSRQGIFDQVDNAREYSVEAIVDVNGALVGKSIAEAGLRHLAYGYLSNIYREGRLMSAVSPETILQADDILVFIGAPECAKELMSFRGLLLAEGDSEKLDVSHSQRCLVEVVLSPDFAGIGSSIRDNRFRSLYQAVVLSVSRRGEQLAGKLGDIKLRVGDTLLLETGNEFVEQFRYRKDFLLVSPLNDSTPPNVQKAPLALVSLAAMIVVSALGIWSLLEAAMFAAGLMIVSGCISIGKARRYVDLSVILVIAASFSLGAAIQSTGLSLALAQTLLSATASPIIVLMLVYIITVVLTELITNNAAAVLMFPLAITLADKLQCNYMPFVVAVMFAASASFITPLGYQTNLMVMGPGGYHFKDYVKLGLPLSIIVATTSILLIPVIWPF